MFSVINFKEKLAGGKFLKSGWHYLLVTAVLFLAIAVLAASQTVGWHLKLDGQNVAAVKKRSVAQNAVEKLRLKYKEVSGSEIEIRQEIEIKPFAIWNTGDRTVESTEKLVDLLDKKIDFITDGAAIAVNGEEEIYLKNSAEARSVLEEVKEKYSPPGKDTKNTSVKFEESVELIEKDEIAVEKIVSPSKAVQKLGGNSAEDVFHPAGGSANINDPLLSVVISYDEETVEEIPYDVIENKDSSMEAGEREVVQEGTPGKAEVTYRVKQKNGETLHKKTVEREVVKEPEPRIVVSGSSLVLASRAGQNIYRPVNGNISSDYGIRHGNMHKGIDIAASHGSEVVAMSSGRVDSAGPYGGYGLAVTIDHGNNLVTRYAHLSQVVVKAGEPVQGGQMIGRVGSSGNSTGPHLHFEVWVGGKTVNPIRYLNSGT